MDREPGTGSTGQLSLVKAGNLANSFEASIELFAVSAAGPVGWRSRQTRASALRFALQAFDLRNLHK